MPPFIIKVLTINFWGNENPLELRMDLALRQFKGLEPHVILMQEVRPLNGKNGPTTADLFARDLGMESVFGKTLEWEDGAFFAGHPGGIEGLAILSKFPIKQHNCLVLPEARKTEKRILLSAQLDTPGGLIWCHSTHLHYRLDDGRARENQVLAIDEHIRSIHTGSPQILGGDFNASPEHDEIRFMRGLTTLDGRRTHYQDAFLRISPKEDGHTWCSDNELTRPLRSLDIDRRIDYIFVTTRQKDGRGTICSARVVLTERAFHNHELGEICASDHLGVMAEIQVTATS